MADGADNKTHFGYKQVEKDRKAEMVADVFHSVASKYDLMNDLMSFGVHRLWKHIAIDLAGVRSGMKVLDLASGTGDLASRFAGLVGPDGEVVMSDINLAMLEEGRKRMVDEGHAGNIEYMQIDAESIPFPDNSFNVVTIAFGLRNVTDKDQALREMYRVLKPGGRYICAEFVSYPGGLWPKKQLYYPEETPLAAGFEVCYQESGPYVTKRHRVGYRDFKLNLNKS